MRKFFLLLLMLIGITCHGNVCSESVKLADRVNIDSNVFDSDREILMALPKSYDSLYQATYPVIYVVRGQLDILSMLAAIDMLSAESPEFIVVGVSGEGSEFLPDEKDHQTDFSMFLHDEVVPYIENNFRVAPFSLLVGHSAAGKFVMNDWLSRGEDFSSYIAISPELHSGKINQKAKMMSNEKIETKKPLMVSMGAEDPRMTSLFEELSNLTQFRQSIDFVEFPDQTHMSTRVHTMMKGLRSIFPNWQPDKKVSSGPFRQLASHYAQLSERYGFDVPIPIETLKREAAFHSASNIEPRWDVARQMIKYAVDKDKSTADEFFSIAEEMKGFGMNEGSQRLTELVCGFVTEHPLCKNSVQRD